ncbi:hypothetical protein FB451DRAFT_1186629 [Mycena latifolia]|nr:hypothetical protein FB451DRAFT_1186629 [Mycena latifolia]
MGFTVQISNWKQVGGLRLIGRLLEQVKLLPKQIPTCGTPSNGVSISNWGWWRPPMQPLTYREASQAIQLSHQMNLPVCAWCTNVKLGMVEASDTAFMGWEASQAVQLSHQMNSPGIYLATSEASDASGRLPSNKFQTGKLKASDTSGINYEPSKEQASKAISRRQYMVPKEPDWRLEEAMIWGTSLNNLSYNLGDSKLPKKITGHVGKTRFLYGGCYDTTSKYFDAINGLDLAARLSAEVALCRSLVAELSVRITSSGVLHRMWMVVSEERELVEWRSQISERRDALHLLVAALNSIQSREMNEHLGQLGSQVQSVGSRVDHVEAQVQNIGVDVRKVGLIISTYLSGEVSRMGSHFRQLEAEIMQKLSEHMMQAFSPHDVLDPVFFVMDPLERVITIQLAHCYSFDDLDRILKAHLHNRPEAGSRLRSGTRFDMSILQRIWAEPKDQRCPHCGHTNSHVADGNWINCLNPTCGRRYQISVEGTAPEIEEILSPQLSSTSYMSNMVPGAGPSDERVCPPIVDACGREMPLCGGIVSVVDQRFRTMPGFGLAWLQSGHGDRWGLPINIGHHPTLDAPNV